MRWCGDGELSGKSMIRHSSGLITGETIFGKVTIAGEHPCLMGVEKTSCDKKLFVVFAGNDVFDRDEETHQKSNYVCERGD